MQRNGACHSLAGPRDAWRAAINAGYVAASLGRLGIAAGDRDDLVSEIFVRVHEELATYDADRPIRPWLFAFAARVASEHRRLARHRREVIGGKGLHGELDFVCRMYGRPRPIPFPSTQVTPLR